MIQFVLETDRGLFDDAFRFAQQQVRKIIETYPDYYPMYTSNGRWKHEGPAWTHWCDGFFPGMMWIFHKRNGPQGGNNGNTRRSTGWTRPSATPSRLEPRKLDREVHDLGFLFMPTFYRWYGSPRSEVERHHH